MSFWNKKELERINFLEERIKCLQKINDDLSQKQTNHDTEIYKYKKELEEIKSKVREQTEADLFFSCAKIQKKLLEGESKENLSQEIIQRNNYYASLQNMQLPLSRDIGNSLANVFGGLYPRF